MARSFLDGRAIVDWDSFHTLCAEAFGFPAFYGRNMNAWIDCLSDLRDGHGMSRFHLAPGESLVIELAASDTMKREVPEIFAALVERVASVNARAPHIGDGPPLLKLELN